MRESHSQTSSVRVTLPKRRPLRVATLVALVLLFVFVATGIIAILAPSPAAASSSSLEVLDGIVAVSHDGAKFNEGKDGDLLQQGDIVRTGDDSHALLTFYDGSTIEVEPNSEIVVETLRATAGGDLLMTMQQDFGRTWHVVSRALTPNSKYEVRTPTSTAAVRGTAFLVTVDAGGRSSIQTTDGIVGTIGSGQEVPVPAGFETSVDPGGVPAAAIAMPAPAAIVRIIVDPTPNALIVDANGRAVGLLGGLPVRYIPGSTIHVIDGKLVITIPNPTLGRLDTHVQPAHPSDTSIDVNVQVVVDGATVGNVIDTRGIDANGVAKGGVVLTTSGTYVIPDEDAKNTKDPRIGRIPPPPPGGVRAPFIDPGTPAPTAIVTAAPSFVPRFLFDPRATAVPAQTPAPPSPTTLAAFRGAYQPYIAPAASGTATPEPNRNLVLFTATTTAPPDLVRLVSPTPTPAPTLGTRLVAPMLLVTPAPSATSRTIIAPLVVPTLTPTPAPTFLIRRTLDPGVPIASLLVSTPTPAPTSAPPLILRSPVLVPLTPAPTTPPPVFGTRPPTIFATDAPLVTAPPVVSAPPTIAPPILITRPPIASVIVITPAPTRPATTTGPSFVPVFTLPPILIATVAPTPVPTPVLTIAPILTVAPRTIAPIVITTPVPTLAPLPTRSINCRLVLC